MRGGRREREEEEEEGRRFFYLENVHRARLINIQAKMFMKPLSLRVNLIARLLVDLLV